MLFCFCLATCDEEKKPTTTKQPKFQVENLHTLFYLFFLRFNYLIPIPIWLCKKFVFDAFVCLRERESTTFSIQLHLMGIKFCKQIDNAEILREENLLKTSGIFFDDPIEGINVTSAKKQSIKVEEPSHQKTLESAFKRMKINFLPICLVLFGIGGWEPLIFNARLNRINRMNSMRLLFFLLLFGVTKLLRERC